MTVWFTRDQFIKDGPVTKGKKLTVVYDTRRLDNIDARAKDDSTFKVWVKTFNNFGEVNKDIMFKKSSDHPISILTLDTSQFLIYNNNDCLLYFSSSDETVWDSNNSQDFKIDVSN